MSELTTSKKNNHQRNTNIEWLRIIAMIMIISSHSFRIWAESSFDGFNYLYRTIIASWGKLGVDLFIIISAWFLSTQEFRFKKVVNLIFQVFSWLLIGTAVFFIYQLAFNNASIKEALAIFLESVIGGFLSPLWSNAYWFFTAYLFMLLFSPLANRILNHFNKKDMIKILVIFSFIPIYFNFGSDMVGNISHFIYIYLLTGYLRKYGCQVLKKFAKLRYIFLLFAVVIISKILVYYLQDQHPIQYYLKMILSKTTANTAQSLIVLVIAFLIFIYTLKQKDRYCAPVNKIAACTFGVYLFHDLHYFTPQLFDFICTKAEEIGFLKFDTLFPIKHFAIVLAVFALGVILELIRDRVIQRPFMEWVDKKYSGQIAKVDKWFNDFNPS